MVSKLVNSVDLQFKSIPENLSLARVLVASMGAQVDMTLNDLEELKVAVSEAVSNGIIHGYENNPDQVIEISVQQYEEKFVISVIDHGRGIDDIKQALNAVSSSSSEHMGLGFVFMKSFMDNVEINSEPNRGTKVTMVKNLVYRPES